MLRMLTDPEFFERELLTVSREQAEFAASEVSGCESCSVDAILADVMNRPGEFEFVGMRP
jgi:hypothetical protein